VDEMEFKPLYKVPKIDSLKDLLTQSSEKYPDNDAFWVKDDSQKYTGIKYSKLKSNVDSLGTALLSMGLDSKQIAIIGENRYEWCVSYLSITCGVGTAVPLDKELPITEIENLLNRSEASAIIYSGKYQQYMEKIKELSKNVKYFINIDLLEDTDNFISFNQLIMRGKKLIESGDKKFLSAIIDPDKMSVLLFTSGTTDMAKGVMLSHRNICFVVTAICSTIYFDSTNRVLSILPLHHTYECTCGFLVMIYSGATIAFTDGLKHIAKNLKEVQPTAIILVPLFLENIAKKIFDQAKKKKSVYIKLRIAMILSNILLHGFRIDIRKKLFKSIHETLGGRLKFAISGAAGLDLKVAKIFRTFGIKIIQGYGLTECAPIVTCNKEFGYIDSSIGQPLPGLDVKITSPDQNDIGEIIVKGNNVMLGYYKNREATDKVINKEGYFHTGDLAYIDQKGFLYMAGRKKNIIVTKNGKNIFPEEVESFLNRSSFIKESLVVGSDDTNSDETIVTAQIVPDIDSIKAKLKISTPTKNDIEKIIRAEVKVINKKMPLYKWVRDIVIRDTELEKTTTHKIKRYTAILNMLTNKQD
jgi:long-chain acyl-CoA synthetase